MITLRAQTIDTATQQCWAILQALPEKDAKKVLASLKVLVSPPKPKAGEQPALEQDEPLRETYERAADVLQDAGVLPKIG